jgi:hypothetical protein
MSSVDWSNVDLVWKHLAPLAKEGKPIDADRIRQAMNQVGRDLGEGPEGQQLFAILKKKAEQESKRASTPPPKRRPTPPRTSFIERSQPKENDD